MLLNAAINLAGSYDTRYGDNSKDIVKQLNKMLKEDKNIEYQDQIYFALGNIAFEEDNKGAVGRLYRGAEDAFACEFVHGDTALVMVSDEEDDIVVVELLGFLHLLKLLAIIRSFTIHTFT